MRILMLGDLVGKPGREAAQTMLPTLREMYAPQFVIANGENAAAGLGITPDIVTALLHSGVDVVTLGNHTWSKHSVVECLDHEPRVLRPANYPAGTPGRGYRIYTASDGTRIGVANLMGRTFMEPLDDPFRLADTILEAFRGKAAISFFDFHGEATSEKMALAYYLNGRASAVVGTHTHVQTADEQVLSQGTAYLSDVGMVGPQHSILGMDAGGVVKRFTTQMPHRLEVAEGAVVLCGVFVDVDAGSGRATHIERIQIRDIV